MLELMKSGALEGLEGEAEFQAFVRREWDSYVQDSARREAREERRKGTVLAQAGGDPAGEQKSFQRMLDEDAGKELTTAADGTITYFQEAPLVELKIEMYQQYKKAENHALILLFGTCGQPLEYGGASNLPSLMRGLHSTIVNGQSTDGALVLFTKVDQAMSGVSSDTCASGMPWHKVGLLWEYDGSDLNEVLIDTLHIKPEHAGGSKSHIGASLFPKGHPWQELPPYSDTDERYRQGECGCTVS